MKETMGNIIKRLRKERNLTQEELAEQLGVTYQAISKWENNYGMPDISQIVPLSTVFNVPTDVLFGRYEVNDAEEVEKIIKDAEKPLRYDNDGYTDEDCFNALLDALKQYPNNIKLLSCTLNHGICVILESENKENERIRKIYNECEREAQLIINYSQDISEVFNARQNLIKLYCSFNQFEKAKEQARKFPGTINTQSIQMAWINRDENNIEEEITNRCNTFAQLLAKIEFELRPLGDCYRRKGQYDDAIKVYKTILDIVEAVYGEEEYTPPLHVLAWVHFRLAECSVLLGDNNAAIEWLEKEYDFNMNAAKHYNKRTQLDIPTLRACEFKYFSNHYHVEDMIDEFNDPRFDVLKNNSRYQVLLEKVNKL